MHSLMTMRRRSLLGVAAGALATPFAAFPQPRGKVWRVGVLRPGPDDAVFRVNVVPFVAALREFGFIEGANLKLEYRVRPGTADEMLALANDLVSEKVDAILAIATPGATAARRATATVPIVAVDLESDPIALKLAASLARPGGNVTGVFLDLPELGGKWLELLREIVPKLARVAALWDPGTGLYMINGAETAGGSMGVTVYRHEVRAPAEFERAFQAAAAQNAQSVLALSSPVFNSANKLIASLAIEHRLPAVMPFPGFADNGGLMAYGPDLKVLFNQAGAAMAKVLRGVRPADIPIERPTRFELAINLRTAKAIGVAFPQSVLVRADRVIE